MVEKRIETAVWKETSIDRFQTPVFVVISGFPYYNGPSNIKKYQESRVSRMWIIRDILNPTTVFRIFVYSRVQISG